MGRVACVYGGKQPAIKTGTTEAPRGQRIAHHDKEQQKRATVCHVPSYAIRSTEFCRHRSRAERRRGQMRCCVRVRWENKRTLSRLRGHHRPGISHIGARWMPTQTQTSILVNSFSLDSFLASGITVRKCSIAALDYDLIKIDDHYVHILHGGWPCSCV